MPCPITDACLATPSLLACTQHADLSAVVYAVLRRTSWRAHAKLVSVTPEGLPLTQPEAALLPLLSPLSVQTMAEFSSRLPGGYRPEVRWASVLLLELVAAPACFP